MDKSAQHIRMKKDFAGLPRDAALFLDFYGALLTAKQAEIMDFYINEDFSISEIAGALGISRQAAHDAIRSGAASIAEYEAKLGLVRSHHRNMASVKAARESLEELGRLLSRMRSDAEAADAGAVCRQIDRISKIAGLLDDNISTLT
jgi:predicted DNA-binding protein YlxM (UPF0122 family)